MNKTLIYRQILKELENVFQGARDAAQRAYDTATDEENEAENKYDTLGLEASYLAHGQSRRVAECEADLIAFKKLNAHQFTQDRPVSTGALVCIEDEQGFERYILLSPVAGGLKIEYNGKTITLITPSAPIGKALSARMVGDDIMVEICGDRKHYQIMDIF